MEGIAVSGAGESVSTLYADDVHQIGAWIVAGFEFVNELGDTGFSHIEIIHHSHHIFLSVSVLEQIHAPKMLQLYRAFVSEPSAERIFAHQHDSAHLLWTINNT